MHRRHLSLILLVLVAAVPVFAGHAWSTYHWNRTGAQITPPIHNNLSGKWPAYFPRAVDDWNASVYIASPYGSAYGPISSAKRCTSATGKIEVCNTTYGQNGWLGLAGISLSGGHIVKGYTKLNDTYYNMPQYDTPAWRAMVICQEIGHDFGLDHQDEGQTNPNLGSCMDYTNNPDGPPSNRYPNAHDYAQLESMYSHLGALLPFDSMVSDATRPRTVVEYMNKADQWGTPVEFDDQGRPTLFVLETGPDEAELTHVFWAPEDPFTNEDERTPRDKKH